MWKKHGNVVVLGGKAKPCKTTIQSSFLNRVLGCVFGAVFGRVLDMVFGVVLTQKSELQTRTSLSFRLRWMILTLAVSLSRS